MATGVDGGGVTALGVTMVTLHGIAHAATALESLGFRLGTSPGVYTIFPPAVVPGDTTADQNYSQVVGGLNPNVRYYWQAIIYDDADEVIFASAEFSFLSASGLGFCEVPCTENIAIPIPGVIPDCMPVCNTPAPG